MTVLVDAVLAPFGVDTASRTSQELAVCIAVQPEVVLTLESLLISFGGSVFLSALYPGGDG